MLLNLIPAVLLAALALPVTAAPAPQDAAEPYPAVAGDAWTTDLAGARAQAAAEGKDLLVNFTGSDWCAACVQLKKEVFELDAFTSKATEHFVLVELDFPEPGGPTYDKMPRELHEANVAERTMFNVTLFPSVYLMTAEGVAYAYTGYRQGGPGPYLRHLDRLRTGEERESVAQHAAIFFDDAASDAARLEAAYVMLGRVLSVHEHRLYSTIEHLDPDDSRGVIAPRLLDAFAREHFQARPDDWAVPKRALEQLAERLPSMRELALYHYYRTLIALNLGELDVAETGIAEMRRLGGVRTDLLGMLESWHARLVDEQADGGEASADESAESAGG